MAIIDTSLVANVTEYYFSTTGTQLSKTGNGIFYAQNDYANLIVVNIEDGIHNNGTTFINFKPSGKTPYVSHWFYMRPQGTVEKEFNGVVRSFYRFAVRVPTIVLQNNNKDTAIANQITIQQRYGSAFLGNFATLVDLETDYPATETLDNNLSVAYVIEPSNVGFYQVEYNTGTSTYEWVLVETVSQFLQRKQFAVDTITVQPGFANELDVTPIDVETSAYVMQVISEVEQDIVDIYDDLDTKQGYIDDLEQFDTDLQAGTIPLTQITLYNEGGNAVGYFDGTRVIFEYDGVKHEVGENLFFIVKCSASIFEGRVVQYNGLVGASGKIYGKMADPREVNTNPRLILGVATESGTSGQEVRVNWFGNVNMATELSINGTPTATGVVYFDSTSAFVGRLTYDKPEAPNVQIEMGVIEAVGPSGTIINIRPTFGEFLKNLHDVHINGDEADGITIMYNGTNSRYEAYDLKGKVLEIEGSISDIEDGTTPIAYDNSLSDLVATTVKTAIDELDSNVSALET
ncbi:MAG: hypothetical protein EOM21_20195, partial [Gammaproteobacteria bacterium]|nr:hypothetical protein [Gammaproteobacteria bacterium]